MTTGGNHLPTTTVTPARVRLFQATQRPARRAGEWVETSWGWCKVDGRLGQRHADLLEAILFCAERARPEDAGTLKLLIDPARVRQVMSDDRYSLQQLWKLLRELRECTIDVETAAMHIMGGIVESAEHTEELTRRDPLTGGERRLWTVRIGKAWVELMRLDLPLRYDPSPITRLRYGISQAIARHVLTHRSEPQGGWVIDGLIGAVAGELDGQARRDARRWLHEDAPGLEEAGVMVSGDRVHRSRPPVGYPPESVGHPPESVGHPPESVGHPPESVGHPPEFSVPLQDL